MASSVLNAPHFQNEDAAFAYVETRLWPCGPVCHHCGNADAKRLRRMQGKTTRKGLIKCYECDKPFTVRMGTIFEYFASAIASVAANHSPDVRQQERHLHPPNPADAGLQHENRVVPWPSYPRGHDRKARRYHFSARRPRLLLKPTKPMSVATRARSLLAPARKCRCSLLWSAAAAFVRFMSPTSPRKNLHPMIARHASPASNFMTDESNIYGGIGWNFASHETVCHSAKEYVRGWLTPTPSRDISQS